MSETAEQRFYRLVGAQIRRDRLNAGMSLDLLSRETGISVSMLSVLERGEHGVSLYRVALICESFGSGIGGFLQAAGV